MVGLKEVVGLAKVIGLNKVMSLKVVVDLADEVGLAKQVRQIPQQPAVLQLCLFKVRTAASPSSFFHSGTHMLANQS